MDKGFFGEKVGSCNGCEYGTNDVKGYEEMIINEKGQFVIRRKVSGDNYHGNSSYDSYDGEYTRKGYVFQVCPFKESTVVDERGRERKKGKICGDNCPLFQRPVFNEKESVWEVRICHGVVHKGSLEDKRRY